MVCLAPSKRFFKMEPAVAHTVSIVMPCACNRTVWYAGIPDSGMPVVYQTMVCRHTCGIPDNGMPAYSGMPVVYQTMVCRHTRLVCRVWYACGIPDNGVWYADWALSRHKQIQKYTALLYMPRPKPRAFGPKLCDFVSLRNTNGCGWASRDAVPLDRCIRRIDARK